MEEKLYQQIVPYVSEVFITIPLWKEGDYRPTLTIWQIPQGETPTDCFYDLKRQKEVIKKFFNDYEGYTCDIEDDVSFKDRLRPGLMKSSFNIKIYQEGEILEKGLNANYSINKLMEIAVELLKTLGKIE